ncbi:MAG: ABC transporter ATP-binding protein [Deltaproteobacteria bacterium]|nr:ABC transporter ATP-binding protein [Deltaproteobacteria bacterium]
MSALISIDAVSLRLQGHVILDELSLRLDAGEVVALLGPSGAGKSTILRLLLGFIAPDGGAVRLGDRVVSSAHRIHIVPEERNLAVIFQDLALWPHLSVEGNLSFGLRAKGVPKEEIVRRSERVLECLGLGALKKRRPGELSGGEQQRVAIARALVLEPDAILLDEPLSSLDIGLRDDLLDVFRELFRETHTTALYVTHDPHEAEQIADRIVILDSGRAVFSGAWSELPPDHESAFVQRLVKATGRDI